MSFDTLFLEHQMTNILTNVLTDLIKHFTVLDAMNKVMIDDIQEEISEINRSLKRENLCIKSEEQYDEIQKELEKSISDKVDEKSKVIIDTLIKNMNMEEK